MSDPAPEWHRPLPVLRLAAGSHFETIIATPAECAALAVRMGLPAIKSLRCGFTLHPRTAGAFRADGHLVARFTQTCVVSLDDFATAMDEKFRLMFVPAGQESDDDPESDDDVPYHGLAIDLGEAAAEQFALLLDPYPRKPDAALADLSGDDPTAESGPPSPFAALARLRRTD